MKHGSLFNGIGGFQLAASWLGWDNVMSCEIDDFCTKLTKQHFPNCIQHGDIKTTDFRIYRGRIDILTGGFPCQPFSQAGKRKGKEDDRHLWPEMLRAVREISPRWIVGENVRGLTNWNGGMVFDEVQTDLETEGYEVLPFLLPACAVNAPHRRDRIWFIAHAAGDGYGYKSRESGCEKNEQQSAQQWAKLDKTIGERNGSNIKRTSIEGIVTHSECIGQSESRRPKGQINSTQNGNWKASWSYDDGRWPTQSPLCGGNNGISNRVDRVKALGNAIVPQVAFQIFKAIEQYENITTTINKP